MARMLGQQLDTVQEAIEALESGRVESYEVEGRSIKYHNLGQLYKREEHLIGQIDNHGREYVPGSNSKPAQRRALVSFS